ncbi:MAG: DUF6691 family protein [Pseudohongiellaceae bacterium]
MMTLTTTGARLSIFAAGLLFGLGLTVSGMSNPAKVIGFLDIAGAWDPTLLLVMGGGIAVTLPAFHWILKRPQPLFAEKFYLPSVKNVDRKLLLGAVLFGLGWAIAGFCPGPALAALVTLNPSVLLFVAAMAGGMLLHRLLLE